MHQAKHKKSENIVKILADLHWSVPVLSALAILLISESIYYLYESENAVDAFSVHFPFMIIVISSVIISVFLMARLLGSDANFEYSVKTSIYSIIPLLIFEIFSSWLSYAYTSPNSSGNPWLSSALWYILSNSFMVMFLILLWFFAKSFLRLNGWKSLAIPGIVLILYMAFSAIIFERF